MHSRDDNERMHTRSLAGDTRMPDNYDMLDLPFAWGRQFYATSPFLAFPLQTGDFERPVVGSLSFLQVYFSDQRSGKFSNKTLSSC